MDNKIQEARYNWADSNENEGTYQDDLSASKLVQYIKGNTSRKLQKEYKELNNQFWGQHLWARGYFVASSGNVTDEIIKEYINNQDLQEKSNCDNFEIG